MNTDKPHVGTITIPLTPEQERQLQEHAAACPSCAEVNAGQAPPETRCADGNALIWSFGADLRNAAFEAASNVPTPPDWLTPKERGIQVDRLNVSLDALRNADHLLREHVDGKVGGPEDSERLGLYQVHDEIQVVNIEPTEQDREFARTLKWADEVTRTGTALGIPPDLLGLSSGPTIETADGSVLGFSHGSRIERGTPTPDGGRLDTVKNAAGEVVARVKITGRTTIDAPPPPDLLEATRPEPSLYAKIYTNAEIDPPIRVPTAGELEALRPYTDFSEFGGIVAAMAFAIHVENRGTIPCPGRTVAGCGDGEDECDYCGSTGEISILAPPSPDPGEHPDPFVREVVGAVRALGSPRTGKTDLGFLRGLAAYDNARHAPSCHPCQGTISGSGEAEGQGCDEEPKGTP